MNNSFICCVFNFTSILLMQFKTRRFTIHLKIGILNQFTIHESILLVMKFTHFGKLSDSPENRDLESILDSLNRDSPTLMLFLSFR